MSVVGASIEVCIGRFILCRLSDGFPYEEFFRERCLQW